LHNPPPHENINECKEEAKYQRRTTGVVAVSIWAVKAMLSNELT